VYVMEADSRGSARRTRPPTTPWLLAMYPLGTTIIMADRCTAKAGWKRWRRSAGGGFSNISRARCRLDTSAWRSARSKACWSFSGYNWFDWRVAARRPIRRRRHLGLPELAVGAASNSNKPAVFHSRRRRWIGFQDQNGWLTRFSTTFDGGIPSKITVCLLYSFTFFCPTTSRSPRSPQLPLDIADELRFRPPRCDRALFYLYIL